MSQVSKTANLMTSHIVYKVKNEEGSVKRLKARLCPYVNGDQERGRIRNDPANAQFGLICVMLSVACVLEFPTGCLDIKGAYLQSGPITREFITRPPREWKTRTRVL